MSHRTTVLGPVNKQYKAECRDCDALRDAEWTNNLDTASTQASDHRRDT